MENSSNIQTRSQARDRTKFFNSIKNNTSLSRQFEAAEFFGLFSAKKSTNDNKHSNIRNTSETNYNSKARRSLTYQENSN